MSVTTVALIAIAAYLALIIYIGYRAHKRSQETSEDFFLVSRKLGSFVLIGTTVATIVNALLFTGVPALVPRGGVIVLFILVVFTLVMVQMYVFGRKIWQVGRTKKFVTYSDLFGDYYQSMSLKILAGVIAVLSIFPFMAVQLSAVGKIVDTATAGAIPYWVGVAIVAISMGIYVHFGGARAVTWTDALQGIFFLFVILVTISLFVYWSGGLSSGTGKAVEILGGKLAFNPNNIPLFIERVIGFSAAFFLWPQVFQRMMMAKSAKVFSRNLIGTSIVLLFVFFGIVVMGLMGTGLAPGLADPDTTISAVYATFWPLGGVLILLAVFAVGMSTIDSQLLAVSSIVTRDFWRRRSESGEQKDKSEFRLGKIWALVFLAIITAFALSEAGRGAVVPLTAVGANLMVLFIAPLVGIFYWKRATTQAAFWSMLLGFIIIVVKQFTPLGESFPTMLGSAGWGLLVSVVVFVLVSLLTSREHLREKQKEYSEILIA